jgi:hypothetical protein
MPRYYFHCVDDDTEGLDLPDDGSAREQAREAFGAMIQQGSIKGSEHMRVVDEHGRSIATFSFRAE